MLDLIIAKVTESYLNSKDFNGYPVYQLKQDFNFDNATAKQVLADLISSQLADVVFGNHHPNPHIKAFPAAPTAEQLDLLESLDFSEHFCLYPRHPSLESHHLISTYDNMTYTKELALGAAQLDFRSFDLSVLEYYRNDPRYHYETDFISGKISIRDTYFGSGAVPEHDKVLLQTFGFAHDKDLNRAAAVFLRYLSGLSPEHQAVWKAKELPQEHQLHPDYLRYSQGHWGTRTSIFRAFLQELDIINSMSELMGRTKLFRNSFINESPKSFGFLLRPTLAEFNKFALLLDQLMSENIDKKFFKQDISLKEEKERTDGKIEVRQKGTIALLEEWLTKSFETEDNEAITKAIQAFRSVRKIRQSPAHSIKDDEFDQKHIHNQRAVIINAYNAVKTIRLIFSLHPSVRDNPPHISNQIKNGQIWTI